MRIVHRGRLGARGVLLVEPTEIGVDVVPVFIARALADGATGQGPAVGLAVGARQHAQVISGLPQNASRCEILRHPQPQAQASQRDSRDGSSGISVSHVLRAQWAAV